jgi:drug/metabolite transporter (DMT)-like permease
LLIAAGRLTIAALVLALVVLVRYRRSLRVLTRKQVVLAVVSGLFLALHFVAFIASLAYTSVANAVVLVATVPLWVALVSPWLLGERAGRSVVVGMCLALAGSVVIVVSDAIAAGDKQVAAFSSRALIGDGLALCGAWAAAAYLMLGRRLRANIPVLPYVFLVYGMAALILNVAVLVCGVNPLGYGAEPYLWIGLLALVPQLLGHSAFNWALGHLPASVVSVALLGEPVGAATLAFLLFGELPHPLILPGAGLVVFGLVFAARR